MKRIYFFTVPVMVLGTIFANATDIRAQDLLSSQGIQERSCNESPAPGGTAQHRKADSPAASGSEQSLASTSKGLKSIRPDKVHLRFAGLTALTEGEVMQAFLEAGLKPCSNLTWTSAGTDKATAILIRLLESKGFLHATVQALRDPEMNSITLDVNEGVRASIAAIRFQGTRLFSPAELEAKTRECLSQLRNSGNLANAGGYDEDALEYCLRSVTSSVRDQGYLQARYKSFKKEVTDERLVITVAFEEGPRFRLGKVTIEGANHISAEQLREMFPMRYGDSGDYSRFGKWLFEDVKKAYGELGYIEYTGEPEPEFTISDPNARDGIVNFKVFIEEGRRFRLGEIRFRGENLPGNLINYSPLQPGDVYRSSAIEELVRNLNKTELFEAIDKDKHTSFGTNDEEDLVVITLDLKRRSP